MNKITGTISAITYSGEMYLADIAVQGGITLTAIAIGSERNEEPLKIGKEVTVCFKATELSIAKDDIGDVSLRNRLPGQIKKIKMGELLCQVTIDFFGNSIVSIITARSAERIGIQEGDDVTGLIKANEMILFEEQDGIIF